MNVEEAIATAERALERMHGVPCAVIRHRHVETRTHFRFFWNSRRAVESSGREGVIPDVAPVLVDKRTGDVHARVEDALLRLPAVDPSTEPGAWAIAQAYVDATYPTGRVRDRVLGERSWCWVFSWNDDRAIAGNVEYRLAGNGPLVVDKRTGALTTLGTATPWHVELDEFELHASGEERVHENSLSGLRDHDVGGAWDSLRIEIRERPRARPATHIEVVPRRLIRLVVGNEPALWARIEDDHYGLLWWVSGLDRFVVLDGVHRLTAALAEGVPPPALALTAIRLGRPTGSTELQEIVDRTVATGTLAVDAMNTLLVNAYDDRPSRTPITRAWPLPGGAAAWHSEVTSAAPSLLAIHRR